MPNAEQNNFIEDIQEISTEKNYWFVRTDSGTNFQTFLENGFIGINWNEITIADLNNRTEIEVKTKLANSKGYNLATIYGKQKTSDAYNKLIRFNNLVRGDVIVIPSTNSDYLAFGEITDDRLYSVTAGENECDYIKRRKVQWLTSAININSLDPTFYKIKKSRHTISNISGYDYYIDSVLYNVYKKNDSSHFVLKVTAQGEINLLKLSEVLKGMYEIMTLVNDEFQLGENIDEGSIRIYLQSPGLFNIKQSGISLLLVALLLGATGCNMNHQTPETKQKIENVYQQNRDTVENVRNNMRGMNINY